MNLEQAIELADHASPAPVSASLALKALRDEIMRLREQAKATAYQWPAFEVVQKWALENGLSGASDDEAYRAYKDAHPQVVGAPVVDGAHHE